jgi:hypothetical protein
MCWSNHEAGRSSWQRETARRESTHRADVRASDAERDDVVHQLSRHTGDGRLTLDEFEERVDRALNARTRGDLDRTLLGLPRARAGAARRSDFAHRLRPVLTLALIALAIVTAGAWILWIVVPFVLCRRAGGHHREWREVGPAPRDDELTLV